MTRRLILMLWVALLPALGQMTDEARLVPLPEALQDSYAQASAKGYLIDPQGLIRGGEARERRKFLEYHAADSLIDLYVVLFKGEQMLLNSSELSGHLLNVRGDGKPTVVIHYYLGRPDRSEMFLSAGLMEVVPITEQGRALANAVQRARTGVSPLDELEKFMVQTSIRIYRMERMLSEGFVSPAPLTKQESKDVAREQALTPLMLFVEFLRAQKYKLIVGFLITVCGYFYLKRLRRRAVYLFPDCEVAERLGGAHAAGVGAVIEFGKNSKPPAAQLEKLKLH